MVLFKLPMWPQGPNLLAAAIYNLRGLYMLVLFPTDRHAIPVRLPVLVRHF